MIIVVGRIRIDRIIDSLVYLSLNVAQVIIEIKVTLLLIVESIEAHVLQRPTSFSGSKGISHRALAGNPTPLGCDEILGTIHGHATLVKLLAVSQYVLAHLSQVKIKISAIVSGIGLLVGVEEGVEQPKLNILHVCGLEIAVVQLSHHSTPPALRIRQRAVHVQIGIKIIRAALRGIISQVEDTQRVSGTAVGALITIGEQLPDINFSDIMVTQLVEIRLDVGRCQ